MSNRRKRPFPWGDLFEELRVLVHQKLDWHTAAALARTSTTEHTACEGLYPRLAQQVVNYWAAPHMMRGKIMGIGRARRIRKVLRHILHVACDVDFRLAQRVTLGVCAGPSLHCGWMLPMEPPCLRVYLLTIACTNPTRLNISAHYYCSDERLPLKGVYVLEDLGLFLERSPEWVARLREAANVK
jgi:hypothetical protein